MIETAVYEMKPHDREYLFQDLSGQVLLDDELSHLLIFPNILITAHQAFLTHEAFSEIARVTTMNIFAHVTNQPFLTGTEL